MVMDKSTMMQYAKELIDQVWTLPEVERVAIKDIEIKNESDEANLRCGIDACYHDHLSDIDIHMWIRLHPADLKDSPHFYQARLSRLGLDQDVFGILFQPRDEKQTEGIRVVLQSMLRMDIRIHVEEDPAAPVLGIPSGCRKTPAQEKYDSFWFIAIQTLAKLLRKDYLISDHLSHMLLMEGLVLQMVERDERCGVNFHRFGYAERLRYLDVDMEAVSHLCRTSDEVYNHIAENLLRAALSYEALMVDRDPCHERKVDQFLAMWESYLFHR